VTSMEFRCTFLAGVAVSTGTNVLTGLDGAGVSIYRLVSILMFFASTGLLLRAAILASAVERRQVALGGRSAELDKALRIARVPQIQILGVITGVAGMVLIVLDLVVR